MFSHFFCSAALVLKFALGLVLESITVTPRMLSTWPRRNLLSSSIWIYTYGYITWTYKNIHGVVMSMTML